MPYMAIAKDLKVNRDQRDWNMDLIMLAPVDQTAHRMRSRERHFNCSEIKCFLKNLNLTEKVTGDALIVLATLRIGSKG